RRAHEVFCRGVSDTRQQRHFNDVVGGKWDGRRTIRNGRHSEILDHRVGQQGAAQPAGIRLRDAAFYKKNTGHKTTRECVYSLLVSSFHPPVVVKSTITPLASPDIKTESRDPQRLISLGLVVVPSSRHNNSKQRICKHNFAGSQGAAGPCWRAAAKNSSCKRRASRSSLMSRMARASARARAASSRSPFSAVAGLPSPR